MAVRARCTAGATVLLAVLSLAVVGCDRGDGRVQDDAQQRMAQGMADAFQPMVTVNPPDGTAGVSPSERVTALAASGRLTQVELRASGGNKIDGALSPDGERWTSTKPLKADTSYVLTAAVRAMSGKETTSTSKFSTLSPSQQVGGKITPDDGSTLTGDRAVSVVFDKPIGDHAAAERALSVVSDPPVNGTTEWRGDRELVWRPDGSWPPGSRVTAEMPMFGKQLGRGLYGARDLRAAFRAAGGDPANGTNPANSAARTDGVNRTGASTRGTGADQARPDDARGPAGLVSNNSAPRVAPTPKATPRPAPRQQTAPAARPTPSRTQSKTEEPSEDSEPTTKKRSSPGLPILG